MEWINLAYLVSAVLFILGLKEGKKAREDTEKEFDDLAGKTAEQQIELLEESLKHTNAMLKKAEKIMFFLLFVVATISMISATKVSYVNKTITYVENTLDRLSPYLEEKNIIELRAQFREVETAENYYLLYEQLEQELKKNGLKSKSDQPL